MAQLVEINQVGKREDLRDFISLIDMKEKPLLAMIPKLPDQKNMTVNWQADLYATPITAGVADGQDVDAYENAAANRALLTNRGQKFRRTAMVGDLAENVSNVAGAKAGELARSIDKKLEEIGRDIEATLCSDNVTQIETGPATPYKTHGLGIFFGTTWSGQDATDVPANFRPVSLQVNTTTNPTEDADFREVVRRTFINYGKRQGMVLLCGTKLKANVTNYTQISSGATSTFSPVRAYTEDLAGQTVTNDIRYYNGDFGDIELHVSLLLNVDTTAGPAAIQGDQRRGYIFPIESLGLTFNRAPRVMRLPDMGGGPRALVDAVCCLVVKNPLASGQFKPTADRT